MARPRQPCQQCGEPTTGQRCRRCFEQGRYKRTGACSACGKQVVGWYEGRLCMACRGVAKRKDPARLQRSAPCIDCGVMCRGVRCNPCAGKAMSGEASPAWKGGTKAKKARTYANHAEANRAASRARYAANREAILADLSANLSFKSRNASGRRRAQPGALVELVDFTAIFAAQGGICGICGDAVAPEDVSFDHIIPLAKGGGHEAANLQLAHLSCNARKGRLEDRR